jgi:hypothetical protein
MVHQWKITKSDGLNLIHKTIISVLRDSNDNKLDLNELITTINHRTKMNHIHHQKKYNKLSKYIKCEYGGMIKFLDNYSIYGISYQNHRPMIHLLNDIIDNTFIPLKIISDDDWIIVD